MSADFTLDGLDAFVGTLLEFKARVAQAVAAGLYMEGNIIMTEAKRQTPVDTGTLRGSGFVALPTIEPGRIELEIGFGGPARSYAVEQHENLFYRHPVGNAKFLERPMNAHETLFADEVASLASRAFDENVGAVPTLLPTNPFEGKAEPL